MGRGFGASRASGSGRGTARCHAGLPHALELMANAMRLVRILCRHARGASKSAVVRGGVCGRAKVVVVVVGTRQEGGRSVSQQLQSMPLPQDARRERARSGGGQTQEGW